MNIDQIFYWCGAAIGVSAAVIAACVCIAFAGWCVKKVCNYWWDRTLTIYRLESLRHYFRIMVENGRTGLLKEVELSRKESRQPDQDEDL
jgi:hypothetical protein